MKMIDNVSTDMEMNEDNTRVIKKVDGYGANDLNFSGVGEIMVTITLKEYRNLVSTAATTENLIQKAEENKRDRDNENEKLKKENDELKAELYSLSKKSGSCTSATEGGAEICSLRKENGGGDEEKDTDIY